MTEVATQTRQQTPIEMICKSLVGDQFKQQLQAALPAGLEVERFARTAVNAIQMHPQKDKFNNCDRQTLFLSVQKAATDGLNLDGREATLIAFWNKDKNTNDISYIPMTQGLVKIARNSGEITAIDSHVVYENDSFRFRPGLDPQPQFEPNWKIPPSERGEPVLAYCVVTLKDGTVISPEPMHRERILQIGNAGKNGNQYDPQKGPHYTEWWKKTAIKNALKYAPKSSELIKVDEHDNFGQGFDFNKLRDITNAARVDINEVFKPKLVEKVDEETGEIEQSTDQFYPAHENTGQPTAAESIKEEESPPFGTLKKELLETKTEADAIAILSKPGFARCKSSEKETLRQMVDGRVTAIQNGMLE